MPAPSTPPDDIALLGHMLLNAREVSQITSGLTRERFDRDSIVRHALVRLTQVIGEAAWRVSDSYKKQHPELPWAQMAGYRHRLVHDYFAVDYDIVWKVATVSIPDLVRILEPLVPPP